jgi:hypothetical protein
MKSATNWDGVDSLTDDDIHQAAADDPDNPILSDTQLKQMRPVAEVLPNLLKIQTKVITALLLMPDGVIQCGLTKNHQSFLDATRDGGDWLGVTRSFYQPSVELF